MNRDENKAWNECGPEKRKEYLDRYRFWSDKVVHQLSFSNNLLLTISVAIFGYFFTKRETIYTEIRFDTSLPIDWPTILFIIGSACIVFSIFAGLILSITRLYDFRVTRHINLIRKRACDKGYLLPDKEFEEKGKGGAFGDFIRMFWNFGKYQITKKEIPAANDSGNNADFYSKFTQLRMFSNSLGRITWILLNYQFGSFLPGIVFYAIVLFIR